jgi:hypothetical protein
VFLASVFFSFVVGIRLAVDAMGLEVAALFALFLFTRRPAP